MITETFCSNSHKPVVKGWPSKVVNRSFFVADDFSGYSRATLVSLCKEIDNDIFLINKSIKDTKQKKGMYKVILAVEAKYQRELSRIKQRRAFLVEVKEWITLALIKERQGSSLDNSTLEPVVINACPNELPAQQKTLHSFVKTTQRKNSDWTQNLCTCAKQRTTHLFDRRVKELLKALIVQEIGPLYREFCESAVRATAIEARDYFDECPDGVAKDRRVKGLNAHIVNLIDRIESLEEF